MPKFMAIVVLTGILGGAVYLLSAYDIKRIDGQIVISPRDQAVDAKAERKQPLAVADDSLPPRNSKKKALRIASFNLEGLGARKLSSMHAAERLARLLDGFDVVALQDIRATHVGSLRELVDAINAKDRHFDFAVSPEVGRGSVNCFNAFIFDKSTVEIDRFKLFAVNDPSGATRCRPLVGIFRARGPRAAEAFTFMLVNVHVDYDLTAGRLNILNDVYRAVRSINPGEDDVILLGNFETDCRRLDKHSWIPNAVWALESTVSTVRGDRLADNLIFDRLATSEFTGRANVVDVVRALNITSNEAMQISGHLPIWAEFSTYEGGHEGHIAGKADERTAR